MTTKEILYAEIENLPERDLRLLLKVARGLVAVEDRPEDVSASKKGGTLFSMLRQVKIDAPEGFSENFNQ